MYLNVPKHPTGEIQLLFNFGASSSITRFWNMNIALLPCGADYLGISYMNYIILSWLKLILNYLTAPPGCLQYFVSSSTIKTVRSFNWVDVGVASSVPPITPISPNPGSVDQISSRNRQLANQDYKMCFRREKILTQVFLFSSLVWLKLIY